MTDVVQPVHVPDGFDLGPKMEACSANERRFVWAFVVEAMDATNAARAAGYTDSGNGAIRVRGHQLRYRERVIDAMEELGRRVFRAQLPLAIKANKALITDKSHPDHHKAVQATLSRLGLAERVGVDVNHTGTVEVNHTDQALADLRVLIGLKVPREKLEEIFGFSGLSRYERMLAEKDSGGPKVIEHQP